MAVTAVTATRMSATVWRIEFTSGLSTPTFYIWIDGVFFQSTTMPFIDIDLGYRTAADIDVYDASDDSPDVRFGSTVTIQWEAVEGAQAYEVDLYDTDTWYQKIRIREAGQWWHSWTSAPLPDCETAEFRVRVIGEQAAGDYRYFSFDVVRRPDHPSATPTLSEGTLSFA